MTVFRIVFWSIIALVSIWRISSLGYLPSLGRIRVSKDVWWLIVGWPLILVLVWWRIPASHQYIWSWYGLLLGVSATIFGAMMKRSEALRYKLAKWGMIATIVAGVLYVGGQSWLEKASAKDAPPPIAGNVPLPPPPPSPEGERKAREFWQNHGFLPDEVEEMVRICQLESYGCNQFEADGVTPLQSRKVDDPKTGTHAIGKYQISEHWYGEQAKLLGYNIYTEPGNQDMALWVRLNYGADEWNTYEAARDVAREKEIGIEAPVEDWSYRKSIPVGHTISIVPVGLVWLQLSDGRTIEIDPKSSFDAGTSKWFRVKSRTNEVVKVRFAFTH